MDDRKINRENIDDWRVKGRKYRWLKSWREKIEMIVKLKREKYGLWKVKRKM